LYTQLLLIVDPALERGYFRLADLLARLAARSAATRSAVRFFAAASDAFVARALRSPAVMFFAAVSPPSLPYFLPKLLRYSSTSLGIRLAMDPS